jgi:hypothetical protein
MANTFELIESKTLASAVASISFTSIPSTFTDLQLVVSARGTTTFANGGYVYLFYPNGATTNLTSRYILGNGTAASSVTDTAPFIYMTPSDYTASTFSSASIYCPNYAGATNKSFSIESVNENNATAANMNLIAGLWSQTTAISSLTITAAGGNFAINTTAYLYGVKNA